MLDEAWQRGCNLSTASCKGNKHRLTDGNTFSNFSGTGIGKGFFGWNIDGDSDKTRDGFLEERQKNDAFIKELPVRIVNVFFKWEYCGMITKNPADKKIPNRGQDINERHHDAERLVPISFSSFSCLVLQLIHWCDGLPKPFFRDRSPTGITDTKVPSLIRLMASAAW